MQHKYCECRSLKTNYLTNITFHTNELALYPAASQLALTDRFMCNAYEFMLCVYYNPDRTAYFDISQCSTGIFITD